MSNGNGHHWSKFVWRDWSSDLALRTCSLAAKGYWMEMLCIMHEGTPVGYLTLGGKPVTTKRMAAYGPCSEREAKKLETELEAAGVFSRTDDGVIYCRRMAREAEADATSKEAWRAHGSNGGNPQIIRGTVEKKERQRPYRRSDSPLKTERIFQRSGGNCHWCGVQLTRDNPTHPHFFHVDHIIAVRDGGGVEEDNLVASCQACNMKRARHGHGTPDNNPPGSPTARVGTDRQQPSEASDSNQNLESRKEDKESLSFSFNYKTPISAPAREAEPSVPAVWAARRDFSEERRQYPARISKAISTVTWALRHIEADDDRGVVTDDDGDLDVAELRDNVRHVMARRRPAKPLSPEQLAIARMQLKVVA